MTLPIRVVRILRLQPNSRQPRRWCYLKLALSVFTSLGLVLTSCHQPDVSNNSDLTQERAIQPIVTPPQHTFDKIVYATRPWKVVFVSQDGPKGHENIANEDCPEVVWCFAWQTAQQMGQDLGVDMELAYVQEDCTDENQCIRQQIQLLAELAERGDIDGLIIGPRDSNLLVPVVEKAIASNIAVIAIGTPINSEQVLTLVTSNDFEGGKLVGQWVAERLKGQGNVVILEGPKYQKNALDRRHGFIAGLRGTDITVLDTETALWTCNKAQAVTEAWLAKFSDIDAVIAASDHMAMGALIAASAANRQDILVTGYDAIPIAKAAIANGFLDATVKQTSDINGHALAVQLMVRYLETDETFPNVVYLPNPTLLSQQHQEEISLAPALNFDASTLSCNL